MKRTQLYLHESIWKTLHVRARQSGTSISELVRQAVREKYARSPASRQQAMMAVVGSWKDREDLPDAKRKALAETCRLRSVLIDSHILIEVSRGRDDVILAVQMRC